jgi:hypothetical protein
VTAFLSAFEPGRSGLYRTPDELTALQQAARRVGIACFNVDLQNVTGKREFLAACAAGLGFPATFGHNWDALADSLRDFSWQPARGYVLHFEQARRLAEAAPQAYAAATEILGIAAQYWESRGSVFLALIDEAPELPAFSA